MDHLLQVKKLLAWNDVGGPSRILSEGWQAETEGYCAGCQVSRIEVGDRVIKSDAGDILANCSCRGEQ